MIPLLVHPESKLTIQPISKNATSSADIVFSQWINNNWSPADVSDDVPAVVIVLRDPYERFLSGLNMFMDLDKNYIWRAAGFTHSFPFISENKTKIRLNDPHFNTQTNDGGIRDHQRYQPEKLRFFWMDATRQTTVWGDVMQWARQCNLRGPHTSDGAKVNVGGKRFVTEVDRDLIYKTYESDYQLIAQITSQKNWINLPHECQVIQTETGCPATPEAWSR